MTERARPGYSLYILVLLVAILSLSYADRYLFSILIPAIKEEFGASDTVLGLIAGPGFIVSYVLFTMPLARLADLWSRRRVLALSATLWSAATAACGLATGIVQIAIARFIVGVGEAGALPPAQSMVAELFSERRRASAMGVLTAAPYFGTVAGLTGGGILAAAVGWRDAFLWLALAGLPLALLIWLTGPKRHPASKATPAPRPVPALVAFRQFWAIPSLRLLALGAGLFNIFGYAGATWMPSYFIRSHGMSVVEAGTWLGIGAAVGGVAGSMASGALVDQLRLRDVRWQLRLPALAYLLAFPAAVLMMLVPGGATVSGVPVVALMTVVSGFLSAVWFGPSLSAISSLVAPQERAQAAAIIVVVVSVVGSLFGPVIAGLLSEYLAAWFGPEGLRYGLLLMSTFSLGSALLYWKAAQHYATDLAAPGILGQTE